MANNVSFDILGRDKASAALNKVGRAADDTGRKFGFLAARTKGMTAGVTVGFGKIAAAIGGVAVGGFVKDVVGLEASFSQTMNTMAAVAKVPQDQIKGLSDLAIQMGKDTTFSATEAANAMLELAKGGLSSATIQAGALQGTLTLAAAGGTDMATAATIASNALNTFGLKGQDMAGVAAALAGGANASTASIESLGEALGQVGPGAKTAGLSLQDTVGVLAAFDNAGIKGSDAGTSLKTMLTRLVPQTDKAATAMKNLGLKFTDAHGSFLPITNIAQQLKTRLSKLSDEQRTTALSTIFGSDATRAATVLMNEGASGIAKYIAATKDQNAAQDVASARMKGTAGAIEQFKGSLETAKLQLGLLIAPAVQAGLGLLTKAINGIGPAAKRLAPAFKVAADGAEGLYKLLVKHDFSTEFKKAFHVEEDSGIVSFLLQINEGARTATANAKKLAAGIVAGFTQGFKTGDWSKLGAALGDGLVTGLKNAKSAIGGLGDALGDLIDSIDWGKLGTNIGDAVRDMLHSVDWKSIGESLGDTVITTFQKLSDLGEKIRVAFKTLMDKVDWKQIGRDSTDAIGQFIEGIDWGKVAKTLAGAAIKSLKIDKSVYDTVVGSAADLVTGMAIEIGKAIGHWFSDAGQWLYGKGKDLVGGLFSGAQDKSSGLGSWFSANVIGPVVGVFKGAPKWLVQKGKDFITGFVDGVWSIAKGIDKWMQRAPVAAIVSPFYGAGKWLVKLGANFISGFVSGAASITKTIASWMYRNAIVPAVGIFGKAGSWLLRYGANFIAGFVGGAVSFMKSIGSIGSWLYSHVAVPGVLVFAKANSWLSRAGRDLIGGLIGGIATRMKGVASWLKSEVVDPIISAVKKFFGIASPSKEFAAIGGHLISGLFKGMGSNVGAAIAKKVFGDMPSALRAIVGKGLISVKNLPKKALDALGSAVGIGQPIGGPAGNTNNEGIVRTLASQYGWGTGAQWDALRSLIMGESGFRNTAQNPTSSAYGIFQFLDSTWGSVGASKTSDPWAQTIAGLKYIARSYGSPANAYAKWSSRSPHWYEQGTPWVPNDQLAFLHKGEAVIPRRVNEARLNGGGTQEITLRIESGGSRMDDFLAEMIRRYVRVNGGNVQAVFGRG